MIEYNSIFIHQSSFTNNIMSDSDELQEIAYMRREYTQGSLCFHDLPSEPMELFERWLKQSYEAKLTDPTAMVIATVDKIGQAYQRIVLMKHYDKRGLVFYTNLNSRKANHINNNSQVSLLFPWHMLERQIMITGKAAYLPTAEVIKYFHSRPRESQISAWISKQSGHIETRDTLERRFFEFEKKFQKYEIPLPCFWGGFRISIEQMEFWQGGKYRLHDRFSYQFDSGKWRINRLEP